MQLRDLAPDLPIAPVLQGWTASDYLRCADLYTAAGIDLIREPLVGLGSICRRQSTRDAGRILTTLHAHDITRLHGFGFKILGRQRYGHLLTSADSMAWSYQARRTPPLTGCTSHINCANCPRYGYAWHHQVTRAVSTQLPLFAAQAGAA